MALVSILHPLDYIYIYLELLFIFKNLRILNRKDIKVLRYKVSQKCTHKAQVI